MTDSIKPSSSFILGVSGGSGSGKTYFARALKERLGSDLCEIISQDNYYIDQSKKFDFDGGSVNFDHPDSIDFSLLAEQIKELKTGKDIQIPIYDFHTHSRQTETRLVCPKKLVIVDGFLIFHPTVLRPLFDDLVFFDTPEDLRFSRRLDRDTKERGRSLDGVHAQFFNQVKPMHDIFVEPSKYFAKTIVKNNEDFDRQILIFCKKMGL